VTAGGAGAGGRTGALAIAVLAGALFGAGLLISGMTIPARVIAFLDPVGGWDPTLAFVMGGAVAAYSILLRLILDRRARPWFDVRFHLPSRKDLDPSLVLGAALFGVGWGLGGLCPGPSLVAAAAATPTALLFVLAMFAGMCLQHWLYPRQTTSTLVPSGARPT
jgi:uncharacterized membrane protein YedE/YeeE